MSLTSYRAAPPRVEGFGSFGDPAFGAGLLRLRTLDVKRLTVICRPGDDLLSQVLRHSTIGAEAFDGRVRDGIGSDRFAEGHQAGKAQQ